MKKQHIIVLITSLFFLSGYSQAQENQNNSEGYQIEINIENLRDTSLILGHYFNQKMYVDDTTQINSSGKAMFKSEEPLLQGIYVVYLPSQRYFDLLIDEDQHFSVSVDTSNFVASMEVSGAEQTQKFNQYQRFIQERQKEAQALQQKLRSVDQQSGEATEIQNQLQQLNSTVQNKWQELVDENPGTMLALFMKGIQEVDMPDFEVPESESNPDSVLRMKRYQYYKNHYFDNIDLTDKRILRTPFFANKVENYFSSVLPQIPDTLLDEGIKIIEEARPAPEVFRYLVQYVFNYANDSQIMGMDKILVGIAEKYYLAGEAEWADEEFLEKLETRVTELKPTLIGNKSHDLKMQSNTGEYHRLHELPAPATILVFWETDCGHCKKAIPKLHKLYREELASKGVEVFAVYTQGDQPEWNEFIEENELFDFINVWDPYRQTEFRKHYDIKSTPTVYIIGKDKEIIGKRIAIDDIPGFVNHYLESNEKQSGVKMKEDEAI